jgi:molybdopterin-guanine dinucleotide biosynthesis protein A
MMDDSARGAPVLAGLVLAGGRSSRFGSDKGAARIAGVSLLDRTVALLAAVVAPVYVAVRSDQLDDPLRRSHQLIVDEQAEIGPAAALLSAHRRFPETAWFVIACDMPRLTAEALRRLHEARDARAAATAYRSSVSGNPEPLCAIYEPATLAAFRRLVLSGGNPSPLAFLVSLLAQDAVKLLQPDSPGLLTNVNTPAEFERIDAGSGEAGRGPAAG